MARLDKLNTRLPWAQAVRLGNHMKFWNDCLFCLLACKAVFRQPHTFRYIDKNGVHTPAPSLFLLPREASRQPSTTFVRFFCLGIGGVVSAFESSIPEVFALVLRSPNTSQIPRWKYFHPACIIDDASHRTIANHYNILFTSHMITIRPIFSKSYSHFVIEQIFDTWGRRSWND